MLNIFYPIFSTQQKHQPANKSQEDEGILSNGSRLRNRRRFLFRDVAGLPTFWEQLKIVKGTLLYK